MKVRNRNVCGLALSVIAFLGVNCAQRNEGSDRPYQSGPQCYQLDLGPCAWSDPIPDSWLNRTPRDHIPMELPDAIRFELTEPSSSERLATWNNGAPAVRLDCDSGPHAIYELGTWRRQADGSIQVSWSWGLGAVSLHIPSLQAAAKGTISTWSDSMGGPRPVCEVELRRKNCKCG